MENSKKRKRDADCPRITYHTSSRTFDRLFQENSLSEMKEVVRRKLGLNPRTSILFAQIRDGKCVDLEDDDDFDAFYALAHSKNSVNVKVTVNGRQDEAQISTPMTPSRKRKRKRAKGADPPVDGGQLYQKPVAEGGEQVVPISKAPLDSGSEPQMKKRKTSSDDIQAGKEQLIPPTRETPSTENGNIPVQPLKTPPNAGDEPRKKKKKNKTPGNDTLVEADEASRSAVDLPPPFPTSIDLPERNVPMAPNQVEDATMERENSKKAKKTQKQKEKSQAEGTLSATEEKTSKRKETKKKDALSGVQGAKESIVPVSTTPEETQISSAESGGNEKSHKKNTEKRRKSKKQHAEVDSTVVSEQSHPSQATAATQVQLNTQEVDTSEVESRLVGEKEDVSSVSAKKSSKEPRKLTPDERKAAEADVDAIFAKVLAAKRAAGSVHVISPDSPQEQGDVLSSSKSKSKKKTVSGSLQTKKTPVDPGVEPSQSASDHKKSTLILGTDCPKSDPTCPLCLSSPLHEKKACPLVLGGPKSMRKRLLELQEASDRGPDNRVEIISELRELLRVAEETSKIHVGSQLNDHEFQLSHRRKPAPTVRNSLSEDSSDELSSKDMSPHTKMSTNQTIETSDTSDESSDNESYGHGNKVSKISNNPKLLETVNLDDLIRGPVSAASRIADLESSDDSTEEEEGDKEENQVLEEDEPEVPRRSRKSGGVFLDSSDEADSGLDDVQSVTEENSPDLISDGASPQHELLPSSGPDRVSFRAVDRIGESQEVDRSADAAFGIALEMDTAILYPTVVQQGPSSDPAIEAGQSLAPSSSRTDLVNTVEVTPLNGTGTPALSAGPSASRPLLTSLRDSPSAHETPDKAKPAGIIQRMKTRHGKAPVSEKSMEATTPSQTPHTRFVQAGQDIQGGVARRTRAATRRATLGTMTPPVLPAKVGRSSRVIRPASQSTEDPIPSTSQDVMSLDTWATLKPSSPILDADATMMVDELEPSSPSQYAPMDVDNPSENEGSQDGPGEDPLFLPSESLPAFPYSQWNGETQESYKNSDENNDENEVATTVQPSRDKPRQSQTTRYRRLTDITSDHGFFSTPTDLRATRSSTTAKKATDMYGRSGKDEIESESESDTENSDAQEQSHIPKSRRAGAKQTNRK